MSYRFHLDHFDLIAPLYDRIIPPAKIDILLQYGQFPIEGYILDVGGGTGRVTRELIKIHPKIVVADRSYGMLQVANNNLKIDLTLCEAENLPFPNNCFERIILIDTLHHVVDARQTLRECLRVLEKDGLLIIQEPDIEQWGGKVIALFEKILFMRSHLLPMQTIHTILDPYAEKIDFIRGQHQFWLFCRKKG